MNDQADDPHINHVSQDVVQTIIHSLCVGEAYVRIYRYEQTAHSTRVDQDDSVSHLIVFAGSQDQLDTLDPQLHGIDPLAVSDLTDAAAVASALVDYYERRGSILDTAARLKGISVFEIDE